MAFVFFVLFATMSAGMWRVIRGPSGADRMCGIQMCGTTSIGLLLVLADWQGIPAMLDVALVVALLAAVAPASLVQLLRAPADDAETGE